MGTLACHLVVDRALDACLARKKAHLTILPYVRVPQFQSHSSLGKKHHRKDVINTLPDELLLEVFRTITDPVDRYACASVCMRWLMLQSHMHEHELGTSDENKFVGSCLQGNLSRTLEGKKATDSRVALIAVGSKARGGLSKLSIKGWPRLKSITDVGISAIGICCKSLQILSIWDCPNIGDDGLSYIGKGCKLLKRLDLMKCPQVGDAGLEAVAKGCSLLSSMSIEKCDMIGNRSLKIVAMFCTLLSSLSLVSCKGVSDEGLISVVTSCTSLKKLHVEKISLLNAGLVCLTQNCNSLEKLKLSHLTMGGFFLSGKLPALSQLKVLQISYCYDLANCCLEVIGESCKSLKVLSLVDCQSITNAGLLSFILHCKSLESLHLEKCSLVSSCSGISDCDFDSDSEAGLASFGCTSLKSLTIVNCKGVGDSCLAMLGFCALQHLNVSGLIGLTNAGLIRFLEKSGSQLSKVNLTGNGQLTDQAVSAVVRCCGDHLQSLMLEGCVGVTDESLKAIGRECNVLKDLDISKCSISDEGILAVLLACGRTLETLSLSGCFKVTDKCLHYIEKSCTSLWALNVKNCTGFSRNRLSSFEAALKCDLCF